MKAYISIAVTFLCLLEGIVTAQEIYSIPLNCVLDGSSGSEFDAGSCQAWEASLPDSIGFTFRARRLNNEVLELSLASSLTFYDSLFYAELRDSLYVIDLNNDGLLDILIEAANGARTGIGTSIARWILLVRDQSGFFTLISLDQFGGLPIKRFGKNNYFESTLLEYNVQGPDRFLVTNLYELRGMAFINAGEKFGYPLFEPWVDEPFNKPSKKNEKLYLFEEPGINWND